MDTIDLLKRLQSEASTFDLEAIQKEVAHTKKVLLQKQMSIEALKIYNMKTLIKVIQTESVPTVIELDEDTISAMEGELCKYLDLYLPRNEEYKKMIRIVSLYLTFIEKKPLHPAGFFHKEGKYVMHKGKVVCPLKKEEIAKGGTLCKYCCSAIGGRLC